ncbi:transcription factor HBP-1b(c38)-like isoform X1 [Primulina tabacum]|uniref:transcription factor HBP-1b(c38)-like isoform X1 n=1 Tax=Primulina tabacum TaxID=48773 RepID=UPI003F593ACE
MAGTKVKIGADDNNNRRSASSVMPSFFSQTPVSNPMGTEANATQSSRLSDYGVLEQYMGFRVGDPSGISQSPRFTSAADGRLSGADLHSQAFNMTRPSTSTLFPGSQVIQFHKSLAPMPNIVSASNAQHENWGDSNMADSSSRTDTSTDAEPGDKNLQFEMGQSAAVVISDSTDKSKERNQDQKTLRRLAQNREAARKSRLRKKAYVQQLENSRMKLTQLEQEVQQARQQGVYITSTADQSHTGSANGVLAFDAEYARWMEEQNRLINELRTAVSSHTNDVELRNIVSNAITHFNDVFRLKGNGAKADVFHILLGMWKTPAERCFMWIGGFRPSELLKLLVNQLEPLSEQQLTGIFNLQQSSHQAEDALSQGMDALQQSLGETLATGSSGSEGSSGNVANYMGQMAMAMGKLGTLEGFIRQADNLRQQTLQQMHRILTTKQSARALLLINDYFSRLRALSSLWLARPQES